MWFNKNNTEDIKNIENLYNEVNNLISQQEKLRKKIADSYPIIDSINKLKEEIDEEKAKNEKLILLNNNIDTLCKHNDELVKKIINIKNFKWFWLIFLLAVVVFLCFGAQCSSHLLSLTDNCTEWQELTPIIIGVVMVLLIMAAMMIYFAHKTQEYLSQKK